jgi:hypothetical protein
VGILGFILSRFRCQHDYPKSKERMGILIDTHYRYYRIRCTGCGKTVELTQE